MLGYLLTCIAKHDKNLFFAGAAAFMWQFSVLVTNWFLEK
jgi:hypothetical protein